MFTLKSFLGMPDVVLRIPTGEIKYLCDAYYGEVIRFQIITTLVNRSATGAGELCEITLKIPLGNSQYLDVPVIRGKPDIIGFRFEPHGVFPDKMLLFETAQVPVNLGDLLGKKAEIYLNVIGQGIKRYNVTITKS